MRGFLERREKRGEGRFERGPFGERPGASPFGDRHSDKTKTGKSSEPLSWSARRRERSKAHNRQATPAVSVSSAATSTDPFFQNFANLPVAGPSHLAVDPLNVDACNVEGFGDAFDESYTEFVGTEGDEEMTAG